jgi:hypothetical protein
MRKEDERSSFLDEDERAEKGDERAHPFIHS